jgi:hypothetical protein
MELLQAALGVRLALSLRNPVAGLHELDLLVDAAVVVEERLLQQLARQPALAGAA